MNQIYFHVFARNHYYDIAVEVLTCIRRSGLIAPITIGLIGDHIAEVELYELAGVIGLRPQIVRTVENTFEYHTLSLLWNDAQDGKFDNCLYIHTKGVTSASPTYTKWRYAMLDAIVCRWRERVRDLETYDCVGCFFLDYWPCFAGNFWWARSDWIRQLPAPQKTSDRFTHERWVIIGPMRAPRALSLYATNVEPYLAESHVLLGQPFRQFVRRLAANAADEK
jgi:hypothetical protein